MSGVGGRLEAVSANRNRATGIHLQSSGVFVSGEATENGKHGIVSDGKENDIRGVVARGNDKSGVVILGVRQSYDGIVSESNGQDDRLPATRGNEP